MSDGVAVIRAVWLLARMTGRTVAVRLRSECRVLRRHYHSHGVVDREDDESEQDRGHEQCLRASMSFADAEDGEPQKADPNRGDTDNGSAEKEQDEEEEDDVVNWEDFA